jgi:hypothetical protein
MWRLAAVPRPRRLPCGQPLLSVAHACRWKVARRRVAAVAIARARRRTPRRGPSFRHALDGRHRAATLAARSAACRPTSAASSCSRRRTPAAKWSTGCNNFAPLPLVHRRQRPAPRHRAADSFPAHARPVAGPGRRISASSRATALSIRFSRRGCPAPTTARSPSRVHGSTAMGDFLVLHHSHTWLAWSADTHRRR